MVRVGREVLAGLGVALWLGAIAAGFSAWETYEATPGERGPTAAAEDPPSEGPWSVVLYAHPHCPCLRASLTGLAELLAAAPAGTGAEVVFVRPPGVPDGWEQTAAWDAAAGLPGVRVRCDAGGAEARRAGAATSGHVVVSDRAGWVAFSGGITRARGRVGESAGKAAVRAILAGGPPAVREAPVFGCPLFGSGCCAEEGCVSERP
jgi:hypothetical protein